MLGHFILHITTELLPLLRGKKRPDEPITIVPIAAMTNIALLFALYPEVKSNIREIVMMGGSVTRGNKGVMSEFNVATDPC